MILCCGEALIDMVPFHASEGDAFRPLPGGSPYNSAVAVGRLGVPVTFLGCLSQDFFGDMLVNRLRDNSVRTNLIVRSEAHSTLAFVKLEQGKEPQYVLYTEGTAVRYFSPADLPATLPVEVQCILFGSISMTMEPIASTIETMILREAKRTDSHAPIISFDPNIRPIMITDRVSYGRRMEVWMAHSTIVKISGADMEFVFPDLRRDEALQRILSLGPRLVITTLGNDGAMAIGKRDDGSLFTATAPVVEVTVADTIGAGDTFHAAFLSWLELHGKMSRSALSALTETDLHDALFFANKAASLVCSRHGAEPPTMAEIDALRA